MFNEVDRIDGTGDYQIAIDPNNFPTTKEIEGRVFRFPTYPGVIPIGKYGAITHLKSRFTFERNRRFRLEGSLYDDREPTNIANGYNFVTVDGLNYEIFFSTGSLSKGSYRLVRTVVRDIAGYEEGFPVPKVYFNPQRPGVFDLTTMVHKRYGWGLWITYNPGVGGQMVNELADWVNDTIANQKLRFWGNC